VLSVLEVLSAVRQDFGVQFDKLTVRAVPEPAEGQSNAHCELSEERDFMTAIGG